MKFLKGKKGIIISFIIGVIVASSITVYAYSYYARDIGYTKPGTNTSISVETALNELYNKENNTTMMITNGNNIGSGIESIEIEHDNDNAIVFSGQSSLTYSLNTTDNFETITSIGYTDGGRGLYYATISVTEGDILYINRSDSGTWGYCFVY